MRGELGNATLEFTLGVALLVAPMVMAVAMLPLWLERQAVAALAAREAARAYVLQSDDTTAAQAARQVAERIADDHRVPAGELSLRLSGRLARGAPVSARAGARVPVLTLPGIGRVGGFTIWAEHREVVDPYRSW